jgi:hypothetical protein
MTVINLIGISGNTIKTYIDENLKIKKLYEKVCDDILHNFSLVIDNKILSIHDDIIITEDVNITTVLLPTNFLVVSIIKDNYITEILKFNITRIINEYKIIDFLNHLKMYINDDYCILSNPELYIYSYINHNNEFINSFTELNFIHLLYDDFNKILDCNYKICIIELLSPIHFGAFHKESTDLNFKNLYLIIKCCKQKYKFIGEILNYKCYYNKFNEPTFEFLINDTPNYDIKFFMSIKGLYFFDSYEKYNHYKNYFDKKIIDVNW